MDADAIGRLAGNAECNFPRHLDTGAAPFNLLFLLLHCRSKVEASAPVLAPADRCRNGAAPEHAELDVFAGHQIYRRLDPATAIVEIGKLNGVPDLPRPDEKSAQSDGTSDALPVKAAGVLRLCP